MKKILYSLFVFAAALSCQGNTEIEPGPKPEPEPEPGIETGKPEPVTFATRLPGTKSVIGGKVGDICSVSWSEADRIGVYAAYDRTKAENEELVNGKDYDPAIFTPDAALTSISGSIVKIQEGTYYAIYPCENDDLVRYNGLGSNVTFRHTLPAKQSGTGKEAVLISAGSESDGFSFSHASALFSFTVPAELDGKLSKIEIDANGVNIAGTSWIDTEIEDVAIPTANQESKVFMEDTNGIAAGSYFLAAAPVDLAEGFMLTAYELGGSRKIFEEEFQSVDLSSSIYKNSGGKVLDLGVIKVFQAPVPYQFDDPEPAFAPIAAVMKRGDSNTSISNGTLGTDAFTFSTLENYSKEGQEIRFEGMTMGTVSANKATEENNCFTVTGVTEGGTLTYVIPVDNSVKGDVEFGFCVNSQYPENVTGEREWTVDWSADGEKWSPVSSLHSYAGAGALTETTNTFKLQGAAITGLMNAGFNIAEPVSGGKLYVRLTSPCAAAVATQTVRINLGYYLKARTTNTSFPGTVVLSENFESCTMPVNMVCGGFLGTFNSCSPIQIPLSDGWSAEGGIAFCGHAGFAKPGNTNEAKYIITQALSSLEGSCDVVLTFKAAVYTVRTGPAKFDTPDFEVAVAEGNGTVETKLDLSDIKTDPYNWHVYCCRVKGADASTKLRIGTTTAKQNNRFYLDDIVVVRE